MSKLEQEINEGNRAEEIKRMQLSQLDDIFGRCEANTLVEAIKIANDWIISKAITEGYQKGFDKGYECKEKEVANNA